MGTFETLKKRIEENFFAERKLLQERKEIAEGLNGLLNVCSIGA